MRKKYSDIQIFRAILFIFILLFHCGAPYSEFGWGGVESFFVLSAFFSMKKYYDNCDLSIRDEIINRVKRLYPPYIAVILVAAMFALLLRKIPYDIIFHLFSVQNIQWMITEYQSPMQPMTAHTWTLSIEVWVALILFLVMKYVHKENKKSFMYLFVVIGISYRIIAILIDGNSFIVSLCPLAHFDAFGCGALLAISLHENKLQIKKAFLCLSVGIFGIIICIIVMAQKDNLTIIEGYKNFSLSKNYLDNIFTGNIYFFITILTCAIIALIIIREHNRKNELKKNVVYRFMEYLGDNSYNLYLFHWPILVCTKHFINSWHLLLVVTFTETLVSSVIFNKIILYVQHQLKKEVIG